ncbi:hypothetical protein PM082_012660 [Marasmius tenuissimus]|nr:hypothetical protein PM082_012660 [Marasmius tenuissimus]
MMFGVNHFTKIPSHQFLVLLNEPNHQTSAGSVAGYPTNFLLQPSDYKLLEWLKASQRPGIATAMARFRKCPDEEDN